MGLSYFDRLTIGHLCVGVLSCSLIQYINIPLGYNFIIANGIHYMIERIEKSVAPNGRVLETKENHIGDITAFFVGWMLAYYFKFDRYVTSKNAPVLWFVLFFFTASELLREIYPYEPLIRGSYTLDN
jgi:hypothetical protein